MFNEEEKLWIKKCQDNPSKYRIYVDNDCISVNDIEAHACSFRFDSYGYEFALNILIHIGCNANYV